MDDVAYYTYMDNQFLWQFALWRLQGLFEAAIVHKLINNKSAKLMGFKQLLIEIQKNYSITKKEIQELLLWANVRNSISHSPPEQHGSIVVTEEDIIEYLTLVKKLYIRWQREKDDIK